MGNRVCIPPASRITMPTVRVPCSPLRFIPFMEVWGNPASGNQSDRIYRSGYSIFIFAISPFPLLLLLHTTGFVNGQFDEDSFQTLIIITLHQTSSGIRHERIIPEEVYYIRLFRIEKMD